MNMVEPVARIRAFKPADSKLVHFLVGKSAMEDLAFANRQAYFHPITLAIWFGMAAIFSQYMGWFNRVAEHGWLGYLHPLPAFASTAVAVMFACDWLNRSTFEDRTTELLHRPDLADVQKYYSRSPSSGFWVLEYGGEMIGLIGMDASRDSLSDKTVADAAISSAKSPKKKLDFTQGTAEIGFIRHFYVDEYYRRAGVQDDLLAHALKHAFEADDTLQTVRAVDSSVKQYVGEALQRFGFQLEKDFERVGTLRWRTGTRVLSRKAWKSRS